MTLTSLFFELLFPKKKTAHIDGGFLYPRKGYGQIVDSLAAQLPATAIKTDHNIIRIEADRRCIRRIHFAARAPIDTDSRVVVSTLPLTVMVKLMGDRMPPPVREDAAALQFRHIRLFLFGSRNRGFHTTHRSTFPIRNFALRVCTSLKTDRPRWRRPMKRR